MTLLDDVNVLTVTRGRTRFTVASRGALPDVRLLTEDTFGLVTETNQRIQTSDSVTNFTTRGRVGYIVTPLLITEDYTNLITETRAGLQAA